MKTDKKTIFLTGATGLVGSYLLKILLQNGHKVYTLARDKNNKSANERVFEVLKFWDQDIADKYFKNCIVVNGDITQENLGLNKNINSLLKNQTEEIFHCAAITEFNKPMEEIRKVNVYGTKNILDFSLECKNLKKVNHISTAYIFGDYKGVFKEDDLDVGQKFNTTYEQSKFEAEKLVVEYRNKGLWIDVFRPAIIVGESTTGKIISFNKAFYQGLRNWNLEIFDKYPGGKGYFFYISFVDDLCRAIFLIFSNTIIKNKTYHLFSSSSRLSFKKAMDWSSKFLGFKKPKIINKKDFLINNPVTSAQKIILKYNFFFLNNDIKLDSKNTENLLKKYNFRFTKFTKKIFFNLLDYAVKTKFLNRLNNNHGCF